mgnify:CR=1 FL=1
MLKEILNLCTILLLAVLLYLANLKYNVPYFYRSFITLFVLAVIYFIFKIVFKTAVSKAVSDPRSQYSFNRTLSVLYYMFIFFVIMAIWIPDTQSLLVSYGLIAAGVAVALTDFFKNFAGGAMIFTTSIYRIGDRIEINGRYGDVIDISILYTTLLEIKEWVEGDQPTGRIAILPNNFVLTNTVINYTKEHSFMFDEIMIPVKYTTDWKVAHDIIIKIVRDETLQTIELARDQLDNIKRRYYLPKSIVEPAVYITITDNWIALSIRYVTEVRDRRNKRSAISKLILEEFQKNNIEVASATFDIVGFPELKVKVKDQDTDTDKTTPA